MCEMLNLNNKIAVRILQYVSEPEMYRNVQPRYKISRCVLNVKWNTGITPVQYNVLLNITNTNNFG